MRPGASWRSWRSTAGTSAVEFALTALPLMLLVLGALEGGLLLWSRSALEGAAMDAARCAAIDSQSCLNVATTPSNTATYAATAATSRGLAGVTASNATVLTGSAAQAACGNTTASVVSVSLAYQAAAVTLVPFQTSLTASACFPLPPG